MLIYLNYIDVLTNSRNYTRLTGDSAIKHSRALSSGI